MRSTLTRRGALGGAAALALASCGGGDPAPSGKPRAGSGAGLLNSIVALEHAAIAAWAAIGEVLRGEARRYARAIREREIANAERMADLVRDLGGTPPRSRPPGRVRAPVPRAARPRRTPSTSRATSRSASCAPTWRACALLPDAEQRRAAAQVAAAQAEDLAVVHVLAGGPAAPRAVRDGGAVNRREAAARGGGGVAARWPARRVAAEPSDSDQLERLLALERRLAAAYEAALARDAIDPALGRLLLGHEREHVRGPRAGARRTAPGAARRRRRPGLDFSSRPAFARSALDLERQDCR